MKNYGRSYRGLSRREEGKARQQGIALMLVLWIITLLTIIAIGTTTTLRTESALANNQVLGATFRAQAEAAIQFAALNLLTQAPPEALADKGTLESMGFWLPDGEPRLWHLGQEALEVRIVNEGSLIDLNVADRSLILGLLKAVGKEDLEAERLADAVLDWRDVDNLHLANGAEDPDYAAAGLPYGAKDGPFQSVEELQQVLGLDRELYQLLAPALTVSSGQASPNTNFAPALVQAALEGLSLAEVEERRRQNAEVLGNTAPSPDRGGPQYRIQVRWATPSGALRAMEALVKVQLGNQPPIQVLERRYALRTTASPEVE